jgi:16S rRNA (cytidine1402-2'-O)-methyltransferase
VVLPGPSAVETALVASGLAAEGYSFLGWVPRAAGERARFLAAALAAPLPSVMFESPRRLPVTLADLARLAPEHPVAVARELTKLHEEVVRGSAAAIAARGVVERGEVCLVVAAAARAERGAPAPEALDAVRELVVLGVPARRASELVARLTGAPRRELYDAAVGVPVKQSPPTLP